MENIVKRPVYTVHINLRRQA